MSSIFIVCLHPELAEPWCDRMPVMIEEVKIIMEQRRQHLLVPQADVLGSRAVQFDAGGTKSAVQEKHSCRDALGGSSVPPSEEGDRPILQDPEVEAGSSSSSTLWRQPSSADGEISSVARWKSQPRLQVFEDLCCEYLRLLFTEPQVWSTFAVPLPEPSLRCYLDGIGIARSRKASELKCLEADASALSDDPLDPELLKVTKLARTCTNIVRKNSHAILLDPESLSTIPNPCDPTVSKRAWEGAQALK